MSLVGECDGQLVNETIQGTLEIGLCNSCPALCALDERGIGRAGAVPAHEQTQGVTLARVTTPAIYDLNALSSAKEGCAGQPTPNNKTRPNLKLPRQYEVPVSRMVFWRKKKQSNGVEPSVHTYGGYPACAYSPSPRRSASPQLP